MRLHGKAGSTRAEATNQSVVGRTLYVNDYGVGALRSFVRDAVLNATTSDTCTVLTQCKEEESADLLVSTRYPASATGQGSLHSVCKIR